jgi:hypothetical protein
VLAQFYPDGEITKRSAEGKELATQTLLNWYSHHLDEVRASYLENWNTFDSDRNALVLATAPRVHFRPVFHADCDQWITLVAEKDPKKKEQLEAWFRGLFHLDRPSPALYVWGRSGIGKTMAIAALSKLWWHGYAPLEEIAAGFNDKLERTPLVAADENIPSDLDLGDLRRWVTQSERGINQKHRRPFNMFGYLRLAFFANNGSIFGRGSGTLTRDDAEAVAKRICVLHAHDDTADFIRETGSLADKLPEHITWLFAQKPEKPTTRFVVELDDQGLSDTIAGARYDHWVTWVLDYLYNPRAIELLNTAAGNPDAWQLRTKGGKLLMSRAASKYTHDPLVQRDFKGALAYFARGERRHVKAPKGGPAIWYREIDVEKLIHASAGEADVERIVATLAVDTEVRNNITE